MSPGVNAGVLRAHTDGVLTNAGLMVNGAAFADAVEAARAHPSLAVGLHLVLVQGRATLPRTAIPDLVDADGYFRNRPIANGLRYFFQPDIRRQLRLEIRAQVEKFLATGLPMSHVDGHLNIHMHPAVLTILIDLAPEFGIGAMRVTRDPLLPALRFDANHAARKVFEAAVFRALGDVAAPRLAARSIRHPDRVYGLHQTGCIDETYLLHVLATLPPGVSEIYCHACLEDAEARRWRPADYRGDTELSGLVSEGVRRAFAEYRIELMSYRALHET